MDKKTIVMTGTTKGIGRALACEFMKAGHFVIGCGRAVEQIDELQKEFAGRGHFSVVDVTSSENVNAWAKQTLTAYGTPDLVINNAGIITPRALFHETSEEAFNRVIDINIKGVANVCRAFLPALLAKGAGIIINFGSGWGKYAASHVSGYCTSKFGVNGFTASLAKEMPKGVGVMELWPGSIDTQQTIICWGEYKTGVTPEQWAPGAVPIILSLSAANNGLVFTIKDNKLIHVQ